MTGLQGGFKMGNSYNEIKVAWSNERNTLITAIRKMERAITERDLRIEYLLKQLYKIKTAMDDVDFDEKDMKYVRLDEEAEFVFGVPEKSEEDDEVFDGKNWVEII